MCACFLQLQQCRLHEYVQTLLSSLLSVYFYTLSSLPGCDCYPDGSTDVQCDLGTGQCTCKVGAGGLKCDSCQSGFFNVTQGCLGTAVNRNVWYTRGISFLVSIACQCNGHSSQCDSVTGVCSGCQDNTEGDYCQLCSDGFFGDATGGTSGDCQPCPCPGTSASTSFSSTCDRKLDGTARCVPLLSTCILFHHRCCVF